MTIKYQREPARAQRTRRAGRRARGYPSDLTDAQWQVTALHQPGDPLTAVPPTQVAAWAGHSVEVLLRIYAKCIDGQDAIAKHRITEALREQGDTASPSPPA